jgi:HlyD family secretion protein
MKSRRFWIIAIGLVVLVALGVGGWLFLRSRQQAAAPQLVTGDVTQITAVSSVETTGSIAPLQSGTVTWTTVGQIKQVNVKVGDVVKRGDILMLLEPATVPQNVILAQADLISAQKALDDLLHPSDMSIANARKAVADAQDALKKAQQDLKSVQNPAGQSLVDAVNDAKLALDNAKTNATLTNVGADASAVQSAEASRNLAYSSLQRAQVEYDDCVKISCGEFDQKDRSLSNAQSAFQQADNNYQTAKLKLDNEGVNQADTIAKAQKKYDDAVANLKAAQAGPDANKLAIAQASVSVAETTLADAQDKLDKLTKGADPKDVASAQARVMAAQATVASIAAFAPFDGEVASVNYQVGDTVQSTVSAATLVNRSQLHVNVQVDESDIGRIKLGDKVIVTFDSLPDVSLDGVVAQIDPLGTSVQGLVKFTVRVNLTNGNPLVLIGMTANINIITDTNAGALAVPLDAVQLDSAGEFVNRVKADNTTERVNVTSSEVQGDLVVVAGPLNVGDKVELVKPKPTNNGGPFGGG